MTRITVTLGDITSEATDVIVNAANSSLAGGGGVDGAIHRAGGPVIAGECQTWVEVNGNLPTGQAMMTSGGDLSASWVIHTVGPVWEAMDSNLADNLLGACYRNSLDLATQVRAETIAFPNISTGVYGFPKPRAAGVAVTSTHGWLAAHPDSIQEIRFVCFDEENQDLYHRELGSR